MKKGIWLLAVLLGVLLAGCGKVSSTNLESETNEFAPFGILKEEMETAWSEGAGMIEYWYGKGTTLLWYDETDESTWVEGIRYYGSWNDTQVLYRYGSGSCYYMEGVPIDDGCFFYRDGEFCSTYSAYKNGWISLEDIRSVSAYHKEISATVKNATVPVYERCEGVTALSPELQAEVEAAWWEKEGCELSWTEDSFGVRYYGEYDGAVAIFFAGMIDDFTRELKVGDIVYQYIGTLYIYKDHEIYDIQSACDAGILTEEDVQTIMKYYTLCTYMKWFEQFDLKEEVESAWRKKHWSKIKWYGDGGNVMYYWTFDGDTVALFEWGKKTQTTSVVADGETFEWTGPFTIHIYQEGKFYSLEDAYEKNLLSVSKLDYLLELHEQYSVLE